jgi:hypothetical protein
MDTLSTGFPIFGDGGRPQGWSWSADAPVFDVPGMDPTIVLAYQLAEQYLRPLLSPSLLTQLAPHFHQGVIASIMQPTHRSQSLMPRSSVKRIGSTPVVSKPLRQPSAHGLP